ncbi:galactose-specific lectin nattectin-like [Enoplosus armatus]|uniref:galactose-specific lectin nattectin-like n=1 Tax=Enoplosus armatus TaxID=215367 RepID=UPI0039912D87
MASALHFIAVLCLTSGLWIGANARPDSDHCCDTCRTCPSGWTQFDDHCYMFNHDQKDWADAEIACIALGGNLASIPNKDVYDFLIKTIQAATDEHRRTWVGGHDTAKEGVWLWTDGTKFDFKLWRRGEPNNTGRSEHCMELNYLGAPNDLSCDPKKSFVCGKCL